jgi:hypothetical protein
MYNKLFTKILDSTIWLESDRTRLVWITLLAVMDEDGYCQLASPANVANRAAVPLEDTKVALAILEAPDPDSSDPDNEGRRIEKVPGGWIVLNAQKYRETVTRIEVKNGNRMRVKRYRQRNEGLPDDEGVDGYVYYARNYDLIKIGFSRNPWSRVKELGKFNPNVELLATERGTYMLEKQRHEQFAAYHKEGEWFTCVDEILNYAKSIVVTTLNSSNVVVTQSEAEADTVAKTLSLAVAKELAKQQKLSRAKKQREAQAKAPTKTDIAKIRHKEFKAAIGLYWKSKNPGVEMPWGAPEGQALEIWLRECPTTTIEQFTGYLRNRFKSEVNHTERPSIWIRNIVGYAQEPLNKFKQPQSTNGSINGGSNGNGHYKGKTEQSLDAAREAIEAIENRRNAGDLGYPATGEVEQPRLPGASS